MVMVGYVIFIPICNEQLDAYVWDESQPPTNIKYNSRISWLTVFQWCPCPNYVGHRQRKAAKSRRKAVVRCASFRPPCDGQAADSTTPKFQACHQIGDYVPCRHGSNEFKKSRGFGSNGFNGSPKHPILWGKSSLGFPWLVFVKFRKLWVFPVSLSSRFMHKPRGLNTQMVPLGSPRDRRFLLATGSGWSKLVS